ncbi:alkylhydroperoxidase [Flavipsychrobacter stenotrophus]|uniref:Alkyl hydroperoxide reductase AhpD n=1 Tax=Flavipsychrobacter stenotrophus TaxID=2077091 RepID=A0A2S7SW95_9BACT|nr:carboxymuconolactone decarboxylase family protein [Flavipsychrobacter stenotrophus]PQJ10887.1 alkylhydroperoxidase [Flavipsychrobacter stenotrophus]
MSTLTNNETIMNLFQDLGIDPEHTSIPLARMAAVDSKSIRDLKLNVSGMLNSKNMTKKEAYMVALSAAANEKHDVLTVAFENLAKKEGATDEEIAEVHACVSIMNVNNIFYRFRHFMGGNEYYDKTPAGLRMSVMMSPVMGKGLFELISLVLSAINGCERCVTSHEHSVKEQGASEPRIYDAIRLGAVIKGLCVTI